MQFVTKLALYLQFSENSAHANMGNSTTGRISYDTQDVGTGWGDMQTLFPLGEG